MYERPPTETENAAYAGRRFAAFRVEPGLYLQRANDDEQLFAIGKFADGAYYGLDPDVYPERFDYWLWGRVPKPELERLVVRDDDELVIDFLRDFANHGGWYRTKRAAIASALASTSGASES